MVARASLVRLGVVLRRFDLGRSDASAGLVRFCVFVAEFKVKAFVFVRSASER